MTEKTFRVESDLLGELKVPADALYGVQTQRGINNYHISRKTMSMYHDFIIAIAYVKLKPSVRPAAKSLTASGMRISPLIWCRVVLAPASI